MHEDDIKSIDGIYRFYANGELKGEQKNSLTSAGRAIVIKSLMGIIPNFVDSIAFGIDSTPNTLNSASTLITNNTLGFEIGRTKAVGNTFDAINSSDAIVFYGEIVDPYQYEIREVAVYPSTNVDSTITVDGSTLFDFDQIDLFIKNGSASTASLTVSASARIGTSVLSMPGNGDGTSNYIEKITDDNSLSFLSSYSSQDLFKFAFFKSHATASGLFYTRFMTDSSNHYTLSFDIPSASGYRILTAQKGSASITGSPSWENITSVRFWNGTASTIAIDAIRSDVGTYLTDTTFGMISRAVLATPIQKPASIPVAIQYSLLINFSGGI
jgi:hypothetical protein